MYPLGIIVTDVNGTGRLVEYLVITVNKFAGNGTGPLCGVVCVQPAARTGENVTVRVLMSNVGNTTLRGVRYEMYAGFGNYIASGELGDLMRCAFCRSVPSGIIELMAFWTPAKAGVFQVGINASDHNRTASMVSFVNVTITSSLLEVLLSVSPSAVKVQPGAIFNVSASIGWPAPNTTGVRLVVPKILS